jgi:hypothetical protein
MSQQGCDLVAVVVATVRGTLMAEKTGAMKIDAMKTGVMTTDARMTAVATDVRMRGAKMTVPVSTTQVKGVAVVVEHLPVEVVAVDVGAVAIPHGLMSLVRSARERAILPKIVGIGSRTMMMKKLMHMA